MRPASERVHDPFETCEIRLPVAPVGNVGADLAAVYPPPPRHPLLIDVNWTAVAVTLIAVGGLAWLSWRIMRSRHKAAGAGDARAAVTVLRGWLLSLAVVALVDNAFGAVTFLVCPALLWVWIEPSRSWFRKAANAVLIAAGFVALIALVASYGQRLRIGAYILWYLFMSVAYGQINLLRTAMTLALFAIALRLFVRTAAPVGTAVSETPGS
jgi:hypothetical protein